MRQFVVLTLLSFTSLFAYQTPSAVADDLTKLCHCEEEAGPLVPKLNPEVLPVDVSLKDIKTCLQAERRDCQACFDCYAWQLFISVNWPAASGEGAAGKPDLYKAFGKPGDLGPVVWETYKGVYDVFRDSKPDPWGKNQPRDLAENSAVINLRDKVQADHNWLTDQDGNVVRYEIRFNEDEFNYIMANSLYHKEGLFEAFTSGKGVSLPTGKSQYGEVGSIEVKAAWRLVPKNRLEEFKKRYIVSMATVQGEGGGPVPIALVGFHVIKKTPQAPQWIWATFEHEDNAPDRGAAAATKQYNFYNSQASADYRPNYTSPPDKYGPDPTPQNQPVQVERLEPIDSEFAVPINKAVHDLIETRYPDSVGKYYELVNVQWPLAPEIPQKVLPEDGNFGNFKYLPTGRPEPQFLSNTTMETYLQKQNSGGGAGVPFPDPGFKSENTGKSSCIGCHRLAAITPTFEKHPGKGWYTDYSNIFFKAQVLKEH